jgi:hypothetical protein
VALLEGGGWCRWARPGGPLRAPGHALRGDLRRPRRLRAGGAGRDGDRWVPHPSGGLPGGRCAGPGSQAAGSKGRRRGRRRADRPPRVARASPTRAPARWPAAAERFYGGRSTWVQRRPGGRRRARGARRGPPRRRWAPRSAWGCAPARGPRLDLPRRPGVSRRRRPRGDLAALVAAPAWLALWPLVITASPPSRPGRAGRSPWRSPSSPTRGAEWAGALAQPVDLVRLGGASPPIGVPLAFLFARAEFPGRRVLGALMALPVALPPLVGVVAFLFLYGESGFGTRAVQAVSGWRSRPGAWPAPGAILLVHAYSMYVYFYLFTRAASPGSTAPSSRRRPRSAPAARGRFLRVTLPAAAAGARRGRPAHLPHRARLVLGAVPVRRRLPGDDDADRRHEAERRAGDLAEVETVVLAGRARSGCGACGGWTAARRRRPAAPRRGAGPSGGSRPAGPLGHGAAAGSGALLLLPAR